MTFGLGSCPPLASQELFRWKGWGLGVAMETGVAANTDPAFAKYRPELWEGNWTGAAGRVR